MKETEILEMHKQVWNRKPTSTCNYCGYLKYSNYGERNFSALCRQYNVKLKREVVYKGNIGTVYYKKCEQCLNREEMKKQNEY